MRKIFAWILMLMLSVSLLGCRKPMTTPATPTPAASERPNDSAASSPDVASSPDASSPDASLSPDATEEPFVEGAYREYEITYPSRGVNVHATVVLPGNSFDPNALAPSGSPDASTAPEGSTSPDASAMPDSSASPDASMLPNAFPSPDASAMPESSASADASTLTAGSASPDASAMPGAASGTTGSESGSMQAAGADSSAEPTAEMHAYATPGNDAMPIAGDTAGMPEHGYPMVVFLHGHGGERNENGGYSRISHVLAASGIASIRMDFAGSGESEEAFTENSLTSMYTDALAAIDFMKANYPIDENAIGVFGFDMGGRVALHLIAQKLFDFRAAVLLAPANSNNDWITMFGGQEEWDRYKADAELNNYTTFTTLYGQVQDLSIQWFSDLEASDDPAALAEQSFRDRALVIYATNDTTVSPDVSRYVADKLGAETLLLDAGGHSYGFYADSADLLEKIAHAAADFFAKTLNDSAITSVR